MRGVRHQVRALERAVEEGSSGGPGRLINKDVDQKVSNTVTYHVWDQVIGLNGAVSSFVKAGRAGVVRWGLAQPVQEEM